MATAFVVGILALCMVFAIYSMIKRKKEGKSLSCGGDCSRCMSGCDKKNIV